MAKYVLTLVFLGLLIVLYFYPTPGGTLDENYHFHKERIIPTEQNAEMEKAVKAALHILPARYEENGTDKASGHKLKHLTLR